MSCIPASHSMTTILSQVESQMEDSPAQRRGSKAYQIFPEADMNEDHEDVLYRRERLPSIVVEPTEQSELESRERWPPQCLRSIAVEEDEDSSTDPTDSSGNAEPQEVTGMEDGMVTRKSSIGPSQSQLSLSRLTPPASPTPPDAAPPCLRS